jgi:hypothetical protein
MTNAVAALTYAALGWHVFPLKPDTKDGHYLSDGHRGASNDLEQVAQWWGQYPDANIGLNLAASGLIAVDPDIYKPGCEWDCFIRDHDLPETLVQSSARGGKHYIFTAPPGDEFAGKLANGVDIKRNGYIVVAPSTFEGKSYRWDNNNNPAPVPDWVPRKVAPQPPRNIVNTAGTAEVEELLSYIPADVSYDDWIRVLMGLHDRYAGSEEGLVVADRWSATGKKYRVGEVVEKWQSFKRGGTHWPTVAATAARYGANLGEIQRRHLDPYKVLGGQPVALPAGASLTPPPAPAQTEPLDGYADIIAAAPHDNGVTTLIECVRTLHGHLPIRFDEFSQTIIATKPMVWDKRGSYPRQWTDLDTIHCQTAAQAMLIRPSKDTTFDAVAMIAHHNRFHPVRDYLNGLAWDGMHRLDGWLHNYFRANDTAFNKLAGAKFMISAVARVMEPGCKADTVLVLEGEQGRRKSSAIAALTGPEWLTDELPDLHTKDAAIQLCGKWIIEVSELSAMARADVETVKKFMSRSVDRYRAPFGKVANDHPRQCVFIATTNDERYLKDQTGNRRFWPVACGDIDVDAIRRDRNQLWAESVARYRGGERWWLTGDENRIAEIEQEDRREVDPWEERIGAHVAGLGGLPTSMDLIARAVLNISYDRQNAGITRRISNCLRHHSYVRQRVSGPDGKRSWMYAPLGPLA